MTSEFNIALHALLVLDDKKDVVSSEHLAKSICTNSARVRKIMLKLKKGNLVQSKGGVDGGYYLEKDVSSLNLKALCDLLEEDMVAASWKSGGTDLECLISTGMAGLITELYKDLNETVLEQLSKITIKDMSDKLKAKRKIMDEYLKKEQ